MLLHSGSPPPEPLTTPSTSRKPVQLSRSRHAASRQDRGPGRVPLEYGTHVTINDHEDGACRAAKPRMTIELKGRTIQRTSIPMLRAPAWPISSRARKQENLV